MIEQGLWRAVRERWDAESIRASLCRREAHRTKNPRFPMADPCCLPMVPA